MGEANLKTEITPNATVKFNIWLLTSRVSESLEASFKTADELSKWIVNGDNEGHKQIRLEIINRLIAEKQMNQCYNASILEMAQAVETWVGLKTLGQLVPVNERYKLG